MPNEIPYRPSSGTEGNYFVAEFCERCKHYCSTPGGDPDCDILARSWWYDINDPKYPTEWVWTGEIGSYRCTAFEVKDGGTGF